MILISYPLESTMEPHTTNSTKGCNTDNLAMEHQV